MFERTRKLVIAFVMTVTISSVVSPLVAQAFDIQMRGDINNDSKVDINDASLLLSAYSKKAAGLQVEIDKNIYDFDEDGSVGLSDVTMLLSFYATNAVGTTNASLSTAINATYEVETNTILEQNTLYLPSLGYEVIFNILPANQENVDAHDIVMDDGTLFSTYSSKYLFGHFHGSFVTLPNTVPGDIITVCENYVPQNYTVITSCEGHINSSNTDIVDSAGNSLLFNNVDPHTPTIYMVTCHGWLDPNARWVVVAVAN